MPAEAPGPSTTEGATTPADGPASSYFDRVTHSSQKISAFTSVVRGNRIHDRRGLLRATRIVTPHSCRSA